MHVRAGRASTGWQRSGAAGAVFELTRLIAFHQKEAARLERFLDLSEYAIASVRPDELKEDCRVSVKIRCRPLFHI